MKILINLILMLTVIVAQDKIIYKCKPYQVLQDVDGKTTVLNIRPLDFDLEYNQEKGILKQISTTYISVLEIQSSISTNEKIIFRNYNETSKGNTIINYTEIPKTNLENDGDKMFEFIISSLNDNTDIMYQMNSICKRR